LKQNFPFLLWSIWKSKKTKIFNKEIFNHVTSLVQAKKQAHNGESKPACRLIVILGGVFFPYHLKPSSEVVSPPSGSVKLNFDRSLINPSTTLGFIIRDWIGKLVKAGMAMHLLSWQKLER